MCYLSHIGGGGGRAARAGGPTGVHSHLHLFMSWLEGRSAGRRGGLSDFLGALAGPCAGPWCRSLQALGPQSGPLPPSQACSLSPSGTSVARGLGVTREERFGEDIFPEQVCGALGQGQQLAWRCHSSAHASLLLCKVRQGEAAPDLFHPGTSWLHHFSGPLFRAVHGRLGWASALRLGEFQDSMPGTHQPLYPEGSTRLSQQHQTHQSHPVPPLWSNFQIFTQAVPHLPSQSPLSLYSGKDPPSKLFWPRQSMETLRRLPLPAVKVGAP